MFSRANSWLNLSYKAARLGLEAQTVIGLRLMRLSLGGAAAASEAELMIAEKAWTALETQVEFTQNTLMGRHYRAADRALDLYRRRVRANRRRLSKPL